MPLPRPPLQEVAFPDRDAISARFELTTIAQLTAFPVDAVRSGQAVVVLGYASAGDGGDGVFHYDTQSQVAANGVTVFAPTSGAGRWKRAFSGPLDIRKAGAVGDGVADDTAAIQAALNACREVYVPEGTFLISAKLTTRKYQRICGTGKGSVLKKAYNGYLLNLAEWAEIRGVYFDGAKATRTGGGVEITLGSNTATIADQGQQLIEDCGFEAFAGYPIDYTTANKGWMSRVIGCRFSNYDSDAAIKWPDESTTGGNRTVTKCYSSGPLVNVGGCDNGMIGGNVTGGTAAAGQGILFPAGTTFGAKKLMVEGNRFAIGGGTLNIDGIDHIFAGNIIAGSVELKVGSSGVVYRDQIITGTFTDNSAQRNNVFLDAYALFTPTISTSVTATTLGNADVRCEYTRRGMQVHAKYFVKVGSTTSWGTGIIKISLPVPRLMPLLTTDFVGTVYLKDRAAVARTLFQVGEDAFWISDPAGTVATPTSPVTLDSGSLIIIDLVYRVG